MAAIIMLEVVRAKRMPYWHNLLGGYKDDLRDNRKQYNKYDLLIISNVTENSTDVKCEKLRDLLELFSDKPIVVTHTGGEPIKFFNWLGYPLHYSAWIRGTRTNRVLGN